MKTLLFIVALVGVTVIVLLRPGNAGGDPLASAEVLHPLLLCPESEPACVQVDLNLVWPTGGSPSDSEDISGHPIVIGHSFFADQKPYNLLAVTGRLNDGEPRLFKLLMQYNGSGEMVCTDFAAAAVGQSASQGAVILTDKGVLELVDTPLRLGCTDCVALIDKKDLTWSGKLSAHWDITYNRNGLVFQRNRDVYWKYRNACIDAMSPGCFKIVDSKNCIGPELRRGDPAAVKRVRDAGIFDNEHAIERLHHDLYELEDAPFFVYVYGVACT